MRKVTAEATNADLHNDNNLCHSLALVQNRPKATERKYTEESTGNKKAMRFSAMKPLWMFSRTLSPPLMETPAASITVGLGL